MPSVQRTKEQIYDLCDRGMAVGRSLEPKGHCACSSRADRRRLTEAFLGFEKSDAEDQMLQSISYRSAAADPAQEAKLFAEARQIGIRDQWQKNILLIRQYVDELEEKADGQRKLSQQKRARLACKLTTRGVLLYITCALGWNTAEAIIYAVSDTPGAGWGGVAGLGLLTIASSLCTGLSCCCFDSYCCVGQPENEAQDGAYAATRYERLRRAGTDDDTFDALMRDPGKRNILELIPGFCDAMRSDADLLYESQRVPGDSKRSGPSESPL
jgi:hypothetical protein